MAAAGKGEGKSGNLVRLLTAAPFSGLWGEYSRGEDAGGSGNMRLVMRFPFRRPLSQGVSTYGRPYQIRFLHFPCHHFCGFLFRACVKPLQSSSGRRTRPLLGDCSLFDARFCGFPFRGFSCFLVVRAGSAAAWVNRFSGRNIEANMSAQNPHPPKILAGSAPWTDSRTTPPVWY